MMSTTVGICSCFVIISSSDMIGTTDSLVNALRSLQKTQVMEAKQSCLASYILMNKKLIPPYITMKK